MYVTCIVYSKIFFSGHRALCIPRVMLTLRRPGPAPARGRGHPGPGAITVTSEPLARGHSAAVITAACHTCRTLPSRVSHAVCLEHYIETDDLFYCVIFTLVLLSRIV